MKTKRCNIYSDMFIRIKRKEKSEQRGERKGMWFIYIMYMGACAVVGEWVLMSLIDEIKKQRKVKQKGEYIYISVSIWI
jgi:hypothetical protein